MNSGLYHVATQPPGGDGGGMYFVIWVLTAIVLLIGMMIHMTNRAGKPYGEGDSNVLGLWGAAIFGVPTALCIIVLMLSGGERSAVPQEKAPPVQEAHDVQ